MSTMIQKSNKFFVISAPMFGLFGCWWMLRCCWRKNENFSMFTVYTIAGERQRLLRFDRPTTKKIANCVHVRAPVILNWAVSFFFVLCHSTIKASSREEVVDIERFKANKRGKSCSYRIGQKGISNCDEDEEWKRVSKQKKNVSWKVTVPDDDIYALFFAVSATLLIIISNGLASERKPSPTRWTINLITKNCIK